MIKIKLDTAKSIPRMVGPQFTDLFWPIACGLWDFFFFQAAGGTRVQGVIAPSNRILKKILGFQIPPIFCIATR
jgi:hypothetical protein